MGAGHFLQFSIFFSLQFLFISHAVTSDFIFDRNNKNIEMLSSSTASKYEISDPYYKFLRKECLSFASEGGKNGQEGRYEDAKDRLKNYIIDMNFHKESPYKTVRDNIDHCYHGVYWPFRQKLQDEIANLFFDSYLFQDNREKIGTNGEVKPRVLFIGGPMGVGKGYVLKKLMSCHFFEGSYTAIDFDLIKEKIPEFNNFSDLLKGIDSDRIKIEKYWAESGRALTNSTYVHLESGLIGELIQENVLRLKKNLIIDGSLVNYHWNYDLMKRFIDQGYDVDVIFIMASEQVILERAKKRAEKGGRKIQEETLRKNIKKVKDGYLFFKEKKEISRFFLIDNETFPQIAYVSKELDLDKVDFFNSCLKK